MPCSGYTEYPLIFQVEKAGAVSVQLENTLSSSLNAITSHSLRREADLRRAHLCPQMHGDGGNVPMEEAQPAFREARKHTPAT